MSIDIETRLRDALAARADLVGPEDLQPLAPVVELRPRWQSPWVLLATAAAVLLVLGVVLQGVGGRPRSDEIAPRPDDPQVVLPDDVGRDWKSVDLSTPPRLDLDGDGVKEEVAFLGEPTKNFNGRLRMQTTLSSTGEEAYGIAEVGTTLDTNVLDPIDADGDGDQELVLYYDDLEAVGGGGYPLVFDLRDGLLVQAVADDPELLVRGQVAVPGSETEFYDLVRVHDYWFKDGRLMSSRSREAYARGNMTLFTPRVAVVDTWEWHLDEDGVLRHAEAGCLLQEDDRRRPCGDEPTDTVPGLPVTRASYAEVGETVDYSSGYGFRARLEGAGDPSLVVESGDGRVIRQPVELPEPLLGRTAPMAVFADGASVVLTSRMDPARMEVLAQDAGRMVHLDPVGEIELTNHTYQRTWLTDQGALLSAVADDDGGWVLWQWTAVSRTEMAALPWGTVCFDDIDAPTSVSAC
jgi:hypothetical protein